MWTKVKSSVKREISEKYLIFFYLVHTAALKGFVVKAFSISERRSDFMRIWEYASRHFFAVKIFSRIFFQIFSTVCLQKFVLLWKCLREKFIQMFSTVCLQKFVLLWKYLREKIYSNIFNCLPADIFCGENGFCGRILTNGCSKS